MDNKNVRKTVDGAIRNKERTKRKIINALEVVFKRDGYKGLTNAAISKEAGVNHTLIRKYFGSLDDLIETYVKEKDFWQLTTNKRITTIFNSKKNVTKFDIVFLLNSLFDKVYDSEELQKILLWELSESSAIMKRIAKDREELGEGLFSLIENLENSKFDLRALFALQIAGLYYLALHAKINGSLFCGIDLNTEEGRKRIIDSMESVIDFAM